MWAMWSGKPTRNEAHTDEPCVQYFQNRPTGKYDVPSHHCIDQWFTRLVVDIALRRLLSKDVIVLKLDLTNTMARIVNG